MLLAHYQVKLVLIVQAECHTLTYHRDHPDKVIHTNVLIAINFNLTEINGGCCCFMLYITLVVHVSECLIANGIQTLDDSCSV